MKAHAGPLRVSLATLALTGVAACGSSTRTSTTTKNTSTTTESTTAPATAPALSRTSTSTTAVPPAPATTAASATAASPASAGSAATTVDHPAGATAKCNDGTYSYAAHHQGACSHHGGVAVFYS